MQQVLMVIQQFGTIHKATPWQNLISAFFESRAVPDGVGRYAEVIKVMECTRTALTTLVQVGDGGWWNHWLAKSQLKA